MGLANYFAIIIGLLFVYFGTLKLVPINLSETEGYDQMHKDFEKFATVLPWSVDPSFYCCLFGWIEVIGGSLMAFGRQPYRTLGALDILLLMLDGIYTVVMLGESILTIGGVIFGAACALAVIVFRDALDGDTGGKPKRS